MKIPTYTAQVGLTKQVPAIRTDATAAGAQARAMGQIGGAMAQLGEQMQKVQTNAAVDRSKILGNDLINKAELESAQEPYSDDYGANNQKRIDSIRQNVLANTKDPLAQREVNNWLDINLSNSGAKMQQFEYKKLIGFQQDSLDTLIFEEEEAIEKEDNPLLIEGSMLTIEALLNQKAELDIISKKDALESGRSIRKGIPVKLADYDAYFKPEQLIEDLKKDDLGKYKGLSKHLIDDYTIKAENRIKSVQNEINLQNKIAIDQRESEIVQSIVNKDINIDPTFVKKEMNDGKITPEFAKSTIANLERKKEYNPSKLESIVKSNELKERAAAIAKQEGAWFGIGRASFKDTAKFRADVIDANTKGYIADSDVESLLKQTSDSFYRDPVFREALMGLAAQSDLYITPEGQSRAKHEMYGNLIKKVMDGKDPQVAVTEVIKEKLSGEIAEIQESDKAVKDFRQFNTADEADNSGLPKGTVVLVGGRRYEI